MSRSHPGKPKPRSPRATAQIVVEGFTEEAFCKHLKSLYARDCGIWVEIHNVRGGSPKDVIETALRRRGFDRTFVFHDTDQPLPELWARKSRAAGHLAITPSPCMEAFLLELRGKPCAGDTAACKRAFEAILPGTAKYDAKAYGRWFPRELLEASRHPLLKRLLSAFAPESSTGRQARSRERGKCR